MRVLLRVFDKDDLVAIHTRSDYDVVLHQAFYFYAVANPELAIVAHGDVAAAIGSHRVKPGVEHAAGLGDAAFEIDPAAVGEIVVIAANHTTIAHLEQVASPVPTPGKFELVTA